MEQDGTPEDVILLRSKYLEEVGRDGDKLVPRDGHNFRMEMVIHGEYQAIASMLVLHGALYVGKPSQEDLAARIATVYKAETRERHSVPLDIDRLDPSTRTWVKQNNISLQTLAQHLFQVRLCKGGQFKLEDLEKQLRDWLESKDLPLKVFGVASANPEPEDRASSEWAQWKEGELARERDKKRALKAKNWDGFRKWGENMRGAPNAFLRAALFGIGNERRYLKNAKLECPSNVSITYTGEELKQYDLNVFLQLLHIQGGEHKGQIEGQECCKFKEREFLQAIGIKGKSGQNKKNFDESLTRLRGGTITLELQCYDKEADEKYTFKYQGGLIMRRASMRGGHLVQLDPALRRLFEGGYTTLDWEKRQRLKGDMARWLYDYVRSGGYAIRLENLQKRMGSTRRLAAFRYDVNEAMRQLAKAGEILEADDYLPGDVLTYTSTVTPGQLADQNRSAA